MLLLVMREIPNPLMIPMNVDEAISYPHFDRLAISVLGGSGISTHCIGVPSQNAVFVRGLRGVNVRNVTMNTLQNVRSL